MLEVYVQFSVLAFVPVVSFSCDVSAEDNP